MSDRIPGSKQAIPAPGFDDYAHVLASVVTMWHGVGTAKMGAASDPFAVVDPATLRVRGVQGLRVADASLFPVVTAGNTNAPTMAVAARAASLIAASNAAGKAPLKARHEALKPKSKRFYRPARWRSRLINSMNKTCTRASVKFGGHF